MKSIRANWAIFAAIAAVFLVAGRTLQKVERLETDVSEIRHRMDAAKVDRSRADDMLTPCVWGGGIYDGDRACVSAFPLSWKSECESRGLVDEDGFAVWADDYPYRSGKSSRLPSADNYEHDSRISAARR